MASMAFTKGLGAVTFSVVENRESLNQIIQFHDNSLGKLISTGLTTVRSVFSFSSKIESEPKKKLRRL